LNPVAATILKATLDYPARFGPELAEDVTSQYFGAVAGLLTEPPAGTVGDRPEPPQVIEKIPLGDVTVEYFTQHPDEIGAFLVEIFADYAVDGDSAALLSALRVIARVRGISTMAAEIGMSRQGLQKAISARGNPRLDAINAIMRAMGYQLIPHRVASR
jgi:probable addiction module antidote protein